MTKLSYNIQLNGRTVKNVSSYQEACNIVKELGRGWSYKAHYTTFDPDDTPEFREACKKHAEKVEAIRQYKRELEHTPFYINPRKDGPH